MDNTPWIMVGLLCLTACLSSAQETAPEYDLKDKQVISSVPDAHESPSTLPATLVVDESNILCPMSRDLLGFNYSLYSHQQVALIDMKDNRIRPDFLQVMQGLPLPLNRISGTESHQFQWKKTLGTMDQRQPMQLWRWVPKQKLGLGIVEWIQTTLTIDPDAAFDVVLNMHLDSPQDAADLIEFLTGDGLSNPNGGENWAQRRIELGIAKPINLRMIELGNEYDHTNALSVDEYVAKCRPYLDAVRAVKPDLKVASQVAGAPWNKKRHPTSEKWRNWQQTVLRELGSDIQYMVFHPYYDGIRIPQIEHYIDVITQDIQQIVGTGKIKLFFSEHARWPRTNPQYKATGKGPKLDFDHAQTMEGCLSAANFLMRMAQRPECGAATYHAMAGGPWAVIRKDTNTNQLYRTGLFPTFQLLNEAFGDQVVSAKLDGKFTAVNMQAYQNQKINYPRLIALVSSQTDGSLNVLLLNRASHMTRNVTFKSRYAYHPTQVRMLTAPNLDALNTMVFQSIQLVDGALPSDINQITVPPHCMMLLKLTRQSN